MSYSAALYDDDTAADVRGLYREFLGDGLAGEAATDTLLAEWAEVLDDPDESSPFWLAGVGIVMERPRGPAHELARVLRPAPSCVADGASYLTPQRKRDAPGAYSVEKGGRRRTADGEPDPSSWRNAYMRRVLPILFVLFAMLAYAPAVAGASPRESFESVGFDAWSSDCGTVTCTDTYVFAQYQTTSSGETFSYACADQFTYNIRSGRGSGFGGCTENVDLTVAGDLSSASLAPTTIEACDGRRCETIIVSAELQGSGDSTTFRARYTERDGTCTFTYTDTGERQYATGSITFDGTTSAAEGWIASFHTTFSSRCR